MSLIRTRIVLVALSLSLPVQGAEGATITITRLDCTRIVRHVPAPDVAYRPGVDVRGRKVAPADLDNGFKVEPPEEFEIPITVDLQDRLGIPANPTLFEAEAKIGTIVYRKGKAWFNGQPLATENTAVLAKVCRERLGGKH